MTRDERIADLKATILKAMTDRGDPHTLTELPDAFTLSWDELAQVVYSWMEQQVPSPAASAVLEALTEAKQRLEAARQREELTAARIRNMVERLEALARWMNDTTR